MQATLWFNNMTFYTTKTIISKSLKDDRSFFCVCKLEQSLLAQNDIKNFNLMNAQDQKYSQASWYSQMATTDSDVLGQTSLREKVINV
jgi:hypothetical protein